MKSTLRKIAGLRMMARGHAPRGVFLGALARALLAPFAVVTPLAVLVPLAVLAPPAYAIVGVEGTFEYALDAPWRIEPSAVRGGVPSYGPIPIQISIHDVNLVGRDRDYFDDTHAIRLGKVCAVTVRERMPGDQFGDPPGGASTTFPFSALDEVEYTFGGWPAPGDPMWPPHDICRAWEGQDCAAFDRVGGTSEWHASLSYTPAGAITGQPLSLQIEIRLNKDPLGGCEIIPAGDVVRLVNDVRIDVAAQPLPRFGPEWLYGDLHYHSQGTDNEGESGYNYRGVLRAMGAMGLDFAFATEHASNSEQIVDVDTEIGDIFAIKWPPAEHRSGLRDMSRPRFQFLLDLLNSPGGANAEAGLITMAGPSEPHTRLRPVPQIFLGGEVDMIPELPPGTHFGDSIPWGNGQEWSTDNLCFGNLSLFGITLIDCQSLGYHLLQQTATNPDAVLVDDIQGFDVDFGRHHIVYLPESGSDGQAFVRSDTGPYGGAHRRFVELRPELEGHGHFFAAHSFSHYERDGFLTDPGPTDIPWTDHLYAQVWESPAFLGLQFWNEDSRLRQSVDKWSADTFTEPVPAREFCSLPIIDPVGQRRYICPTPGDDVGYERYDEPVAGIGYATLPVQNAQAGFGTGLFHLDVSPPIDGLWSNSSSGVEEKLHHGAFTWDRLNHWGLDVHKTLDLPWLPSFLAPRRLFMAGGSDAHGDLNYRRTGYLVRTEAINDAALGKPRNLVEVGAPAGAALARGRDLPPVAVHSQGQISRAIESGRFSITDGPALRIVADLNRNGVIDADEPTMGDVVDLDATRSLPLLIEWKSTDEFGPVVRVDLYVGARSSAADLAESGHAVGRTYAPYMPGVYHTSIPGLDHGAPAPDPLVEAPPYNQMNDNYWEDPTGLLRFEPADGLAGTRSVTLEFDRFPAMQNRPADRFFVRAFAVTDRLQSDCGLFLLPEGCLRRYAFTNPIWAVDTAYLCSAEAGLDTVAPTVDCNAPATIPRHRLPLSFTATSEDLCGAAVSVGGVECYALHEDGRRTQRHCVLSAAGDTLRIDRADGVATIVSWNATATDPAGNSTTTRCETRTENSPAPPRARATQRALPPPGGAPAAPAASPAAPPAAPPNPGSGPRPIGDERGATR